LDLFQVFDKSTGIVVRQFGTAGSGHGQLQSPDAVSVDANLIYVTDNSNHRVQVRHTFCLFVGGRK
jgi:hypothetical protein